MYGFHKTVNITDGSLRQSEKARKGEKPPSMYSHPYFRRNRPDLLWLIQKPSTKATGKRRRDGTTKGEYDSDDDRPGSPNADIKPLGELGRTDSREMVTMPKTELNQVRRELIELRKQQKYIRDVIEGLKKQNDQFYRQATQSQALHERHENSINAILTFLATFYNRSLEGHAGQNLVNMFTGLGQQSNQQQGSVVEDIGESTQDTNNQVQRYRKPPLLLPPPTTASNITNQPIGSVTTAANSARSSASPAAQDARRSSRVASANANKSYQTSPLVKNEALIPEGNLPESDQMMSLINSVNANSPGTTTPNLDFSAALDHYQNANGQTPLTAQQRNDVLSLMAANQQNSASNKNALTTPTPPVMPDLNQYKETQAQLEMLQNMQKQQDEKVQELNRRLQPLSPTGAIPGLADGGEGGGFFDPTGAPGDFDPDAFLNFDNNGDIDFDFGNAGGDNDVQWDFGNSDGAGDVSFNSTGDAQDKSHLQAPDAGDGHDRGRVESLSSAATSPAPSAAQAEDEPGTPKKRLRRS